MARQKLWDIKDLAAVTDLALEHGVTPGAITNWAARYKDFPKPVVLLGNRPIYSKAQVAQWKRDTGK